MISNEDLVYYSNILNDFYSNHTSFSYELLSALKKNIRDFFKQLTQDENQFFSSNYSRLVYCFDKFNIPKNLSYKIFRFRYLSNNINSKSEQKEIKIALDLGVNAFKELILFFDTPNRTGEQVHSKLEIDDFHIPTNFQNIKKTNTLDFLSIIVEDKGIGKKESLFIIGFNEILGDVKVYIDQKWKTLWDNVWKSAKINIFDLQIAQKSREITLFNTNNSMLILEPDILLDVTDLSNCFLSSGFTPLPYFLNRMIPSTATSNMIQGNLINSIFDEIISNPDISFDEAYDKAIKIKPIQIFALASINITILKEIKKWLKENFEILKQRISEIEDSQISVEPSFYSPAYGLQGRLDLLLEFKDDPSRKIIIELKSGKAPGTNSAIKTAEGNFIKTGLWESHLAQTTCYNMLLDSTFPGRTGSSRILYVSDTNNPFRNAPNIIQKKQEIAQGRNTIITLEKKILDGDFSFFDKLITEEFYDLPQFIYQDIKTIKRIFDESSELEIDYFKHYYRFILGEIYYGRVGADNDHNSNGKSSIWRDSIEEKISSMDVLPFLELDLENSDFEKLHLSFFKPQNDNFVTSLRKGDLAILYPMPTDSNSAPINNQIIKCNIKEITYNNVRVSLRNKLIHKDIFIKTHKWIIEQDFIDSTDKYLFHSLINFLSSGKEKKDILLGLTQPQADEFNELNFPSLTPLQNAIVSKAINAKDYFIIQGPPGTGKTSYILRTLAEYYNSIPDMNILILAYTNRAVDEICNALKKIENLNFLRLGSKQASNFTEHLISYLAENIPLRDLFKIFTENRFFVSTVSSVLVNPEIFNMKSFHLAIVDEASQILEPQLIGILSKVEKFILIGDEKQLPAVVLQDDTRLKVNNENLQKIQLQNFSQSLFERLLRCCINNNWDNSYGMLTEQARMHKDIQFLANTLFYNNTLKFFDSHAWQTEPMEHHGNGITDNDYTPLLSILIHNRIIFIDSDIERSQKKHHQEAKRIKKLIDALELIYSENFESDKIGIITPFRAQCNEIYSQIPERLKKRITVDTVERFQGSERDIIIISFAVNHQRMINQISSIFNLNGFTIDRKLNVAITRAKKQLILLGSAQILSKSEIYRMLVELIKQNFCYISSDQFNKICND